MSERASSFSSICGLDWWNGSCETPLAAGSANSKAGGGTAPSKKLTPPARWSRHLSSRVSRADRGDDDDAARPSYRYWYKICLSNNQPFGNRSFWKFGPTSF